MIDEPKQDDAKKWEPKVGDRVTCEAFGNFGKVIGVQPPGMEGPTQTKWKVLVKWDNTSLQDSWHDAGDLEFPDAPPSPESQGL